jgi:hypothetical protein
MLLLVFSIPRFIKSRGDLSCEEIYIIEMKIFVARMYIENEGSS